MKKKVFFVAMAKLTGVDKKYHQFHVEAVDAREAFEKVDRWTGIYKVESITVREEINHAIYPTDRNLYGNKE
jgi:isocitrate dehydrogenase kinase/phosphatase